MNERLISSLSTEACIENQSICEHKFTKHREWKTFFIKKITAPFFISKHLFQRNIYLSIVWISCLEGCFWHQYMQNEMGIGTSYKKVQSKWGYVYPLFKKVYFMYYMKMRQIERGKTSPNWGVKKKGGFSALIKWGYNNIF